MKVQLIKYRHYTEVVFTRLADEYDWPVKFTPQFREIIQRAICAKSHIMSRKQLSDALKVCKQIVADPSLMHGLA